MWRDPALGDQGTELSSGRNIRQSFGPLIRDEVTIAAITGGVLCVRIGAQEGIAGAGSVVLVAAGEPFSGETASAEGWSWRVFFPAIATLAALSGENPAGPPQRGPQAAAAPFRLNVALARRLATLHRAVELDEASPEARQQAFAAAMSAALQDGLHPPGWPRRALPGSKGLRQAIDCVHKRFCDPGLTIPDIAAAAGYSQFHFMRSFAAAMGVTVHDYLVQCRLHAARVLLAKGTPAAEVALTVGFADQSHLIRQFRAVFGVTPGAYSEQSRRRSVFRSAAPGVRPAPGTGGGTAVRSKG